MVIAWFSVFKVCEGSETQPYCTWKEQQAQKDNNSPVLLIDLYFYKVPPFSTPPTSSLSDSASEGKISWLFRQLDGEEQFSSQSALIVPPFQAD